MTNPYWKLRLEIKWVKSHAPLYSMKTCGCQSMFAQIEPDTCRDCRGSGLIRVEEPYPNKPEYPPGLQEHLERAYKEFMTNNEYTI